MIQLMNIYIKDQSAVYQVPYEYYNMENLVSPVQQNDFDCGMFTLLAIDYLSRNKQLLYTESMINEKRILFANQIYRQKIDLE